MPDTLRKFSPRKLRAVLITAFWLVMMGWLVQREFFASQRIHAYKPFISKNMLLSDQWMGIYFQQKLVGFLNSSVEPLFIAQGQSGYRITSNTVMHVSILRQRTKISFAGVATVDENYQLRSFKFDLLSGEYRLSVFGRLRPGKSVDFTVTSPAGTTSRKIPLPRDKGVIFASLVSPFHSFGNLAVGNRYSLSVFNPFSLNLEPLEITVEKKETLEIGGEPVEAFVVKTDYRGMRQVCWVDAQGEILKEETGMGFTMLRVPPGQATTLYERLVQAEVDITDMVSVPAALPLPADKISALTLRLRGVADIEMLRSPRQQVLDDDVAPPGTAVIRISREKLPAAGAPLPVRAFPEFLVSTDFIQAADARIQATAREIVGAEADSLAAALKINRWVATHLRKKPVVSVPSAVDVLRTREGDCNEHAVLMCALARAAGIPAKIHIGLAYVDGRFYYHAWPSVYVGVWIDMDPTFGQDVADAAHIKLLEGDVPQQLDVVRLLGAIAVEVQEAE
ncbi:MAG: transglutaminase domain-containing protein [Candidatus Omnitrophica bacterium]|nr:transglutaminase domain-containing protein [Candidatus Omnitrophota bacterium]